MGRFHGLEQVGTASGEHDGGRDVENVQNGQQTDGRRSDERRQLEREDQGDDQQAGDMQINRE